MDYVHKFIEKYPQRISFILTGSSARKIKRHGANLLAGRAWEYHLFPISSIEFEFDIDTALQFGTLPKLLMRPKVTARFLKSYVNTYLREEIQQEALVRNYEGFVRFIDLAAQFNGEIINYSKIAKAAGVADKTVTDYFSILIDTLVAFRIDGWSRSVKKQLVQAPRYYFFDNGVLNALRNELKLEIRRNTFRFGKLFEFFVLQECIRLNAYYESDFRFFYWRTDSGLEVDLILSRGNFSETIAIEIKSSQAPNEDDTSHLKKFLEDNPQSKAFIFAMTEHSYDIGPIQVLPWKDGLRKIFEK